MTVTVQAPAKINLTLAVTGRRPDGYHTLDSVFQAVTLYDEVTVTETGDGRISLFLEKTDLPADASNTAFRAAEVFFRETGLENPGVAVTVRKRIPQQAGLGGGSADAAGTLWALSRLFAPHLSRKALCGMGLSVGADVPFCLIGGAARVTGIGEVLRPILPLPMCEILLMKPAKGVSTAAAYRAVDAFPYGNSTTSERMEAALLRGDLAAAGRCVSNGFETALALPEVAEAVAAARAAGALGSAMTGSGSAVFALFDDQGRRQACLESLSGTGVDCFSVQPCRTGVRETGAE